MKSKIINNRLIIKQSQVGIELIVHKMGLRKTEEQTQIFGLVFHKKTEQLKTVD
ncbi:hypothetical protein P872_22595 [Rhodonellum psychrophilum GCM71 = DSM 17998]|uniref:Uncharacterized protein n=1 Tax=Rhodonellum psychrophilum GCM71 = DSM 17998 TaxID=1123057 RepID=U5C9K8_9BACT|nr:hypothetical protein P872_22595 [Rhodonellum psychrophilum GCM71 = DSM 17998]